jgi:CubicO group peptidase (beta-lactamase class C family)
MRIFFRNILLIALVLPWASVLRAQLPPATAEKIDSIVTKTLADTGAPSASLTVVKDNQIAYVEAYGQARLEIAASLRKLAAMRKTPMVY